MTNRNKLINWLKDNQKKPVHLNIMVYELSILKNFKNGFIVEPDSDNEYILTDKSNKNDDEVHLYLNKYIAQDEDIKINTEEDEITCDCEISIGDHFTIEINFV